MLSKQVHLLMYITTFAFSLILIDMPEQALEWFPLGSGFINYAYMYNMEPYAISLRLPYHVTGVFYELLRHEAENLRDMLCLDFYSKLKFRDQKLIRSSKLVHVLVHTCTVTIYT